MRYMLDTNICIYLLKHQPQIVVERFRACQVGDVVMSAITWAELLRGCDVHEPQAEFDALRALIPVVPFDEQAAAVFAQTLKRLPHKPNFDTLIASHAKSLGLILVTNNTADFQRFDIVMENWLQG